MAGCYLKVLKLIEIKNKCNYCQVHWFTSSSVHKIEHEHHYRLNQGFILELFLYVY